MANIGYIRVSSSKQTIQHQKYEITNFALKNGIKIDEWIYNRCPMVLGIDEHYFSKKKRYATTFVNLSKHKVWAQKSVIQSNIALLVP